jgi:hypothetical protein
MSDIIKQNGNSQINDTRNAFNGKVKKLSLLGRSKKVQWNGMRRYRNI